MSSLLMSRDNYCLYWIPSTMLHDLTTRGIVGRWSRNRPEDVLRVNQIRKRADKKGYIDGIIAFAHLEGTLQCYDGNHRRMALHSGLTCPVLVSVLWNATHRSVASEFNTVNLAVSVPLIYIDDTIDNSTKIAVVEFVSRLSKTYPTHCSQSKAPQMPNFNRDQLIDQLTEMATSSRYSRVTPQELVAFLDVVNTCYSQERYGFRRCALKTHVAAKCLQTGLWLFCT